MCEKCYKEGGSPQIINDKTKKAAYLIGTIYDQDDCPTGGYAHIVTDDWNLDDESIEFCIKETNNDREDFDYGISEEGKKACLYCLNFMLELSVNERYSAMAISCGYLSVD